MTTESSKPRSHKRVPREPTQEMIRAGSRYINIVEIWHTMHDAAPDLPAREWSDQVAEQEPDDTGNDSMRHKINQIRFLNMEAVALRAAEHDEGLASIMEGAAETIAQLTEDRDRRIRAGLAAAAPRAEKTMGWVCVKCGLPRVADEWQHRHACIKGGVCSNVSDQSADLDEQLKRRLVLIADWLAKCCVPDISDHTMGVASDDILLAIKRMNTQARELSSLRTDVSDWSKP